MKGKVLFLITHKVHNFEREDLKQLPTFAAYKLFFILDGENYAQIDGLPMGCPLGPRLANTFYVISRKKAFRMSSRIVYESYVDDIFVTFNSHTQLLSLFIMSITSILTSNLLLKLNK